MTMMLAGVEVVMMDTVRGAIRASGGIWGGGGREKTLGKNLRNFCKKIGPAERLGRVRPQCTWESA